MRIHCRKHLNIKIHNNVLKYWSFEQRKIKKYEPKRYLEITHGGENEL
jgi:hypothetical protein